MKRTYHFRVTPAASHTPVHAAHESPILIVLSSVNVARPFLRGMFGEHHCPRTQMIFGVIVMAAGVVVAKYVGHMPHPIVAYLGDGVGYALHGLGLTPFVEHLSRMFRK